MDFRGFLLFDYYGNKSAEDEDEPCDVPHSRSKADEEVGYHDNEPHYVVEPASKHLSERLTLVVLQYHVEHILADRSPQEDEPSDVPRSCSEADEEEKYHDGEPHDRGDLRENILQILKPVFSVRCKLFFFTLWQGIKSFLDLVNATEHVTVSVKLTHTAINQLFVFRLKLFRDVATCLLGGRRAYLITYCSDLFLQFSFHIILPEISQPN